MATATKEFGVGDEVEVYLPTSPPAFFPAKITAVNTEGTYNITVHWGAANQYNIDKEYLQSLSTLSVGDSVVVNVKGAIKKGFIATTKSGDLFDVSFDDITETLNLDRNEIGRVPDGSGETASDVLLSGASASGASASGASATPSTPTLASTELSSEQKMELEKNTDYKAYQIAKKVVDSPSPKDTLQEELDKITSGKYGSHLRKHIENENWDAKFKEGRKTPYKNAEILASINGIISDAKHAPDVVKRFLKDYKTNEQELLRFPGDSPYLYTYQEGVHSSDAFVRAVCDKMQRLLTTSFKKIFREKRREDYSKHLENTPKSIPSVKDLEEFFDSNPDKSTILLFMTMVRSMLVIEPLLKVHYDSFGRALQKTFKTPSLFLNKSKITEELYGKTYASDIVNKDRTEAELTRLLSEIATKVAAEPKADIKGASEIYNIIEKKLDEYKRVLGENNDQYKEAKQLVKNSPFTDDGTVRANLPFWKKWKQRVRRYLPFFGGKKTKHRVLKTRRPHVVRRKTHHKKRRSVHTRRQLQVRR